MKKIYRFCNFFFKIFFFICSLIQLLRNIKKIRNKKIIIYQSAGGFGHTIIVSNFIKYLDQIKNKSIILIQQFDYSRYNKFLLKSINISHIHLPRNLSFNIGSKFVLLGSQEYHQKLKKKKIFEYNNLFYKLILLIKKKNTELKTEKQLYEEIISKYFPNKYSQKNEPPHRRKASCFYYLTDFTKPLRLEKINRSIIQKKINLIKKKLNKNKLVCLYIRHRKGNDTFFNKPRNNNLYDYMKLINFLNKNKYLVLLIGDTKFFNLKKIKNIFTSKILNLNKDAFDIFASTESDIFIGTEGGAQNLAVQLDKKKLSVNHFPYGHQTKNTKILYKNILFNNKQLSISQCKSKLMFERYLNNNFKIKDNSPQQILDFVRKNIN